MTRPRNCPRTTCPECRVDLWWEIFQGMRLYRENDGKRIYNAFCPKCKRYFDLEG